MERKIKDDEIKRREKLSQLVTQLCGERSKREVARKSSVAASYISGIINCKYMPSAETLRKLAAAEPRGGVTLEMLMVAAGYQENVTELNAFQIVLNDLKEQLNAKDIIIREQRRTIDMLIHKKERGE